MCGIAGIWHLDNVKVSKQKLEKFTDALFHRGPDGAGYKVFDDVNLGLGHRRLSILDLSNAGKQPMSFAEQRYWITFNGEIYNFLELKTELKLKGYVFKTDTDTEVILSAYHEWGFECFNKFNGMWAIALYDKELKKMLLCRDRFGVKPLYYTKQNNVFAFASETIAFKNLDDFACVPHEQVMLNCIENPVEIEGTGYTIWENIYQLLPGHFMEFQLDETCLVQKRWFTIPVQKTRLSYEQSVEQFFHLFENALKLRLRSDVPVATALSGGLDSSSIYCMLHHLKSLNIKSERVNYQAIKGYVATFEGTEQDETEYAREVVNFYNGSANFLQTNFNTIVSNIESSTKLFNDISATPISVLGDVYKNMRAENFLVSLDGHGVDEMMYGYRSLVGMAINEAIYNLDFNYEKDLIETLVNMHLPVQRNEARTKLKAKSAHLKSTLGLNNGFTKMLHYLKQQIKKIVLHKNLNYRAASKDGNVFSYLQLSNAPINLNDYSQAERELAIDFYYRNLPYNMKDFDRAAMQHGVEIRMPFMDYNLVNFIFSLPMNYKVGNGYTKKILRDSMKNIVPEKVRLRTSKIGMGAPINHWFNNELNHYLLETVHSTKFETSNFWNGIVLQKMVTEKCKQKSWTQEEAQKFWNILNANIILS